MWDANAWSKDFSIALQNHDKDRLHSLRVEVYDETLLDVLNGYYFTKEGKKVVFKDYREMVYGTKFYRDEICSNTLSRDSSFPVVEVIEKGTLEVVKSLIDKGENPAVLNFASRKNPGGGVITGAGAQEESLFRCSNYFKSLYQFANYAKHYNLEKRPQSYPLDKNYGGIYSPNVTIYRGNEDEGYPKLDCPWETNFIAVPAINSPSLVKDENDKYWLEDTMENATKNKIRTIYRIAVINGHKQLVLGAFGCGAFKNPPHHIAKLFNEVLHEEEFKSSFSHIVFAIIENQNSHKWFNPEGNVIPFKKEFNC